MVGWFDKAKKFFTQVGEGVKTVIQHAAPVVEKLAPMVSTMVRQIPGYGEAISQGVNVGAGMFGAANNYINGTDDGGGGDVNIAQGRGSGMASVRGRMRPSLLSRKIST
jgi:hypothetical protein